MFAHRYAADEHVAIAPLRKWIAYEVTTDRGCLSGIERVERAGLQVSRSLFAIYLCEPDLAIFVNLIP
jgi:hypothetical protein